MSEANGQSEQPTNDLESLELKLPDESAAPKDLALWSGVLVLLTLIVYWPVTTGAFLWRDDRTILSPLLRMPGGFSQIWLERWQKPEDFAFAVYQPVALTANWLAIRLTGHSGALSPVAFHVVSLIVHAGSAVLLWFLLRELRMSCAWMIAAVFALHPIHAESVAWISAQATPLAGLFCLATAYTYLLFVQSREVDATDRAAGGAGVDPAQTWGFYAGAVALFFLAVLSDPSAVVLPGIVLLLLWWRNRLKSLDGLLLVPLLIAGMILWFANIDLHPARVPAGWGLRASLLGHAMWFAGLKFVAPVGMSVIYPPPSPSSSAFVLAIIAGLVVLYLIRKRVGVGPFIALVVYVLFAAAAVNWFDPTRLSAITDGTGYLAIVPLVAVLAALIADVIKRTKLPATVTPAQVSVSVSAVILLAFGSLAWARTHVFESSTTLWRDTVRKNPQSAFAEASLAEQLRLAAVSDAAQSDPDGAKAGFDDAILHAQNALRLDPASAQAELTWASVLVTEGEVAAALDHYERATQINSTDPTIRSDYASALITLGRFKPAVTQLNVALQTDVNSSAPHRMLGQAYEGLGDHDRAISEEQIALQLDYSDTLARQKLAEIQAGQGKYEAAIKNYAIILSDKTQLRRPELWLALGKIKAQQNQPEAAVQYLKPASELDPDSTEIKNLLAVETEKLKQTLATRPATQTVLPGR